MEDAGSVASTPSPFAVAGMNCIRPVAPAGETAELLKFDSVFATPASRAGEMPYLAPAWVKRSAYGTPARRLPVAADVRAVLVPSARTRRISVGLPTSWTLTTSPSWG